MYNPVDKPVDNIGTVAKCLNPKALPPAGLALRKGVGGKNGDKFCGVDPSYPPTILMRNFSYRTVQCP